MIKVHVCLTILLCPCPLPKAAAAQDPRAKDLCVHFQERVEEEWLLSDWMLRTGGGRIAGLLNNLKHGT
jgi:hypothetical protein